MTSTEQTEDAAVRALIREAASAWGDAERYAALFTEDAEYIAFDGSRAPGREAIEQSHRPLFERFLKGTTLTISVKSVRFPAPGVAVIHGRGGVVRRRQQVSSRGNDSVQTWVAVKQDGRWRFIAFQNTRYRPFSNTVLGKLLGWVGLAPPVEGSAEQP